MLTETTRRASKGPLYNLLSCKTETFANSYFNRIVPLWNNLSLELRQCSSLSIFKRILIRVIIYPYLTISLLVLILVPG